MLTVEPHVTDVRTAYAQFRQLCWRLERKLVRESSPSSRRSQRRQVQCGVLVLLFAFAVNCFGQEHPPSPAEVYKDLFADVQMAQVFADQKTFVDCVPKNGETPQQILTAYHAQKSQPGFDLAAFVHQHFEEPVIPASHYVAKPHETMEQHIDALWPVLTRQPESARPGSSLLPLPKPYVVPGDRFREIYYWDSYFTMLGLAQSGHRDLVEDMVDNFAYLIDHYGHIPNGNRSYYLDRSQPSFFAPMVLIVAEFDPKHAAQYLPELKKEWEYRMEGADALKPGQAHRRVVRMPDGSLLNRYWSDSDTPRDESYREDVMTAKEQSARPVNEVYRELRAGAESGWDFCTRWLADGKTLPTIHVSDFVAVDLNSLMYVLETTISRYAQDAGDRATAERFAKFAEARKTAIQKYMWNASGGYFVDYDWRAGKQNPQLTDAATYPLFAKLATPQQSKQSADALRKGLLRPGGLDTTSIESGLQWDSPNGWAPLEWMAIEGLRRSGQPQLAEDIARRWIATVQAVYDKHQTLVEKYNVVSSATGGGGEYRLQIGFGWTNGVTKKLLSMYVVPKAKAKAATAK
jgi:alpha,alpha-trehalase